MKKVKVLLSLLIAAAMFFGCGPSDQTILKKYETHSQVESAANKAGISAVLTDSVSGIVFHISYSNPALNLNKGNVDLLSERLFIANAENPSELLGAKFVTAMHENASNDSTKASYFSTITVTKETAAKYVLVCFKGIDKSEFAAVETPPCFFIVSLDKKNPHILTDTPLSAGELVVADYTKGKFIRFTEPQIYSGTIPFEKSKNVEVEFTLSTDASQITELKLLAKELYLSNKNNVESENNSAKNEYQFSEKSTMSTKVHFQTSFGTMTGDLLQEYKTSEPLKTVVPKDEVGSSGMEYLIFKGGIKTTTPVETLNDKIISSNMPVLFDLSITDACIYGTMKVAMRGCGTKQVYVVLRNITTPQEVPENILETLDK